MKGTVAHVARDASKDRATELQQWFYDPEHQKRIAYLETLFEMASAATLERHYEDATVGPVDVIVASRKKRIHLRGYSHHITWHRNCYIVEFARHLGISDRGVFVRRARLVGVPDGHGDHIVEGTSWTQPYFTSFKWYAVEAKDFHPDDVPLVIEALEQFLSD